MYWRYRGFYEDHHARVWRKPVKLRPSSTEYVSTFPPSNFYQLTIPHVAAQPAPCSLPGFGISPVPAFVAIASEGLSCVPLRTPRWNVCQVTKCCGGVYLQFAVQWASIALVYYDYALTFPAEIKYIWRASHFRMSTILYFFCRYALLGNVLYLLGIAGKFNIDQARHVLIFIYRSSAYGALFVGAISVLGRAAVIIVFTGRAYALWSKSRIVLGLLGSLGLACFILDCMHVPGLVCGGPVGSNIHIGVYTPQAKPRILAAALTMWRSVQALLGPSKVRTNTFYYLIFEQGTLSFVVISLFTTAAAVLNSRTPNGVIERLLNALSLPLTCTLIARFILYLREWDEHKLKGSQGGSLPEHAVSTFKAVEQVANSIIDDFGEDPVMLARRGSDMDTIVEELRLEEVSTPTSSKESPK
ncbi:hypothetical protein EVG20_g470 [Dentipellis fragilis]|uniref:DUF6533 domain-containing protein n=1 Tax=Dentipellis fragilis TaxID=205917 RepID=A0A4Y9ZFH3_9AGAM|nr:hypothetical protein EVG20_g470 [Dentipellis fragilis]